MKSSVADLVQTLTFNKMLPIWMDNFARNIQQILNGKDIKELERMDKEPCLVVGAGPSIRYFKQLDILKKWKGNIIACDKMLIPLLERGIKPKIVCSVDADESVSNFYAGSLVKKNRDVKAVMSATSIHPKVIEKCPLEIYFFIPIWDDPLKPTSLTRVFYFMVRKTMMETYGNSGSCAWAIAHFLGCDPIGILGLDYAYYTNDIRETTYFQTFKTLSRGKMDKILSYYKRVRTWAGYEVLTDIMWLTYLQLFLPALSRAKSTTYNLSPLSIITNDKVRGMDLEEFIHRFS